MVTFDYDACSSCSLCTAICPIGVISEEEDGRPVIGPGREAICVSCGQCEAHCPVQAVTVDYPGAQPFAGAASAPPITSQQMGTHLVGRRSVRLYQDAPVEKKTIEELMEIVRFAPTASNSQPLSWTIVSGPKVKELSQGVVDWLKGAIAADPSNPMSQYFKVFISEWQKGNDRVLRKAPHLAIVHGSMAGPLRNTDGAIAATYFEVAAPAFGIGTCWAGMFMIAAHASPEFKARLELPEGHSVQAALMFGYPEYKPLRVPKRNAARVRWM